VSEELLVSLFLPDSENKLHDGAVIIKNLRIAQAGAVLPLSANARLDKALGTRHRAAIGVTEETDAVVVVVSEERGSISLCFGGNIARDLDSPTLRKALLGLFQKQKRRTTTQKPKEREVPAALEALPFEKPLPNEEADSAQLTVDRPDAGEAEDTKRDAVEPKPAESS
jgi:diadenylate cyclase